MQETKLDELDVIHLDQYQCVFKHRKQKVMRKSGGIAVLIRDNLFKHFNYVESECEYVLWFKLSKCLFGTEEDIMFGSVYIPPAGSGYNNDNYTPGIYAEGYIVFVFPFVRSYVRMFVRSFVRSYFLPSRGICVKVLR